jgi:hypothetical protein
VLSEDRKPLHLLPTVTEGSGCGAVARLLRRARLHSFREIFGIVYIRLRLLRDKGPPADAGGTDKKARPLTQAVLTR